MLLTNSFVSKPALINTALLIIIDQWPLICTASTEFCSKLRDNIKLPLAKTYKRTIMCPFHIHNWCCVCDNKVWNYWNRLRGTCKFIYTSSKIPVTANFIRRASFCFSHPNWPVGSQSFSSVDCHGDTSNTLSSNTIFKYWMHRCNSGWVLIHFKICILPICEPFQVTGLVLHT